MRERIVEVKAVLGEHGTRQFRFGSGLLIGGRTVLTAAHTVADATAVFVRTSDKREIPAVLDPAWIGDPQRCDLALLEVTELADGLSFLPVALVDRQSPSSAFIENCTAIGFPEFAEEDGEDGSSVRKSAQVGGRIAPLSHLDDGLLSLEVTARPHDLPDSDTALDASPWAGMSGAAVLADDQLVGVICEHARRRGPSDITVTPLDFLADPQRVTGDWWQRFGVADPTALPKLPTPVRPDSSTTPKSPPRRVRFNLSHVDPYFAGRETELTTLARALASETRVLVSQVVAGLGGVGKTQLAARYVRDHTDELEIVAWFRAESSPIPDLAALASELRLDALGDATAEQRAEQVVHWLSTCEERWLLVFDNVTTEASVRPWLPTAGRGRILMTSRNRRLDTLGALVPVDVFDDETGADYLMERAGRDDRAAALALSHALGGLPLALAHAGAYCQAGTSFADYRAMLDGLPARKLFERDPEAFAVDTVATTWQVSIEAAVKRAPLAWEVLAVAAYLAPDAIPTVLFETLLKDSTDIVERKRLRDALAALYGLSLIELSDTTMDVHRLLQKVVRDNNEARGDGGPEAAALGVLAYALPHDPTLPTWWPQYEVLLPHVIAISDTTAAEHRPRQVVGLLHAMCNFLLRADPGRRSLAMAQRALAIGERLLGPEHPDTFAARANLATSYWSAGRTQEAIQLKEQVLADRERLLGAEHPNTLTARANLATSYWSAGRTQEAIQLGEQVLADSERLLGAEHPDTLIARANLAACYHEAGRTQEATPLLEHTLADSERLLGAEHPDTLTARTNLATSYQEAGRTQEAIQLLEHTLADSERLLGAEHPDTLIARANLAVCYHGAGRTQEAIQLEELVLADSERLLGAEHPDTLTARANLATFYQMAGRTQEATQLLKQALADRERLLGADHPDTLTARANLAASYWSAGRTQEAIQLLEQALADRERLLGADHPSTISSRANLAASYHEAGRTQEAIQLLEQALADSERLLGAEHPNTIVFARALDQLRKDEP